MRRALAMAAVVVWGVPAVAGAQPTPAPAPAPAPAAPSAPPSQLARWQDPSALRSLIRTLGMAKKQPSAPDLLDMVDDEALSLLAQELPPEARRTDPGDVEADQTDEGGMGAMGATDRPKGVRGRPLTAAEQRRVREIAAALAGLAGRKDAKSVDERRTLLEELLKLAEAAAGKSPPHRHGEMEGRKP